MPDWLLYILGCIGFALALIGGAGCYATLEEFDFEQDDHVEFVRPFALLAFGLILMFCGWPA